MPWRSNSDSITSAELASSQFASSTISTAPVPMSAISTRSVRPVRSSSRVVGGTDAATGSPMIRVAAFMSRFERSARAVLCGSTSPSSSMIIAIACIGRNGSSNTVARTTGTRLASRRWPMRRVSVVLPTPGSPNSSTGLVASAFTMRSTHSLRGRSVVIADGIVSRSIGGGTIGLPISWRRICDSISATSGAMTAPMSASASLWARMTRTASTWRVASV